MNNALRNLIAFGFVSAALAAGCTVSNDEPSDGSGGSSGSAGSGTGGSTGGSGGSTGGSGGSTGGSAGTGGSTGGSAGSGGGGVTCDTADPDECTACIATKCCTQWMACGADDDCYNGGPTAGQGEIFCAFECIQGVLADAGVATDDDKIDCVSSCATTGHSLISSATQDLFICINGDMTADAGASDGGSTDCAFECFGG